MSPNEGALFGFALLLLLLAGSMPVGYVMAAVGLVGFAVMVSPAAAFSMATIDLYTTFSDYNLTTIPLFVLMGQIAFHTGISRGLFHAAYHWMGRLPGGLAMSTIGACTAFGAICGSGPATSATIASVALPEMRRYRYDMQLATGCVAAGGGIGMLIPPSIVFIVYAILTEQSIGKLFIAGVAPGLMIALLFWAVIYFECKRHPHLGPPGPVFSWRERFASLKGVWETLTLFVLVMGGMFAGFFTATEGAAVGAAGTLVIALLKRELTWRKFTQCLNESIRTACMVMVIVAGAIIFGKFLAVTQVPSTLAAWLSGLPLPGWGIIGLIMLFYLVGGCFLDALALDILTIPIFYPLILALGYDIIWFGVMIVVVTMMGVITPPVGVCVYVVAGMSRDVPIEKIFRGSMPFLGALVLAAILLILFPQIATFLPGLIK
ncbi:MAG TPA: TRAP transporter large permease [Verrucomicrobiota bacterium]|jgi:tripartite ATP-independent transporter DctM subunit|nr:TRAP transporter large permease [Verrucomicrobiota bacterium]OQC25968.1 MAG: Sialic acid TRAP transporter permease protein SiaT [Verrucomicrobia bacterium ADurb.Bin063]HCL91627.1 C4-dicarboxylate ABC transporter permease [Limisphaerales bacterium]HRR63732.1 TRAP transporter large permease [Candidatus Paceibacterota bacterium]MBP8015300.1 TRAP transporter large permease [Verrucomicrobiota bacterium]